MPRAWTVVDTAGTPQGPLQLRQRGPKDFMILHAGRVLMTTMHHATELEVARLGCAPIADRARARVLIGGLGLGFTARAALDALGPRASVTIAELNPVVVRWCGGPAADAAGRPLDDPRATAVVEDVAALVRRGARSGPRYDAIIYDLYIGPDDTAAGSRDPLYGDALVADAHAALTPGGTFAVWGEEPSKRFEARLRRVGFDVRSERSRASGPHHTLTVGTRR